MKDEIKELTLEQIQFLLLKYLMLDEAKKKSVDYMQGFLAGHKVGKLEGELFEEE